VIGIAAQAWSVESLATVPRGGSLTAGPYTATLDGVVPRTGPNYTETVAQLTIRDRDRHAIGSLEPGRRFYSTRNMAVSEASLLTVGVSQVYASVGESLPDGSLGLRLYYKPLVLLIWIGAVVMALGGGLSLTDRRFRVGAPIARRARGAAMPKAVPAE
jgi:cytochrome c-type biogenesis protein CcmF